MKKAIFTITVLILSYTAIAQTNSIFQVFQQGYSNIIEQIGIPKDISIDSGASTFTKDEDAVSLLKNTYNEDSSKFEFGMPQLGLFVFYISELTKKNSTIVLSYDDMNISFDATKKVYLITIKKDSNFELPSKISLRIIFLLW